MLVFWIFMLLMDLLIPFLMIGFGRSFSKKAPDKINCLFGYRTQRSMKNRETWNFAHHYIGRLWFFGGLIFLPLSVIPLICVFGKEIDLIGTVGGIVIGPQLLLLIGTVFPTEHALKKNFDPYGRRRDK